MCFLYESLPCSRPAHSGWSTLNVLRHSAVDFWLTLILVTSVDANKYSYENLEKERRLQAFYNGVQVINVQLSQLKLYNPATIRCRLLVLTAMYVV